MEITFPTTAEAFIAYQEAGTGRNFNIHEKELMEKSVEILNESYERGKTGERMPFPESEEAARQMLSDMGKDDLRTGAGGGASMSADDVYYILVDTPIGRIPLIGATMTDEREREIGKKYSVKEKSSL